ncbi:transposase [Nannocystis pusilla]|uniref:transposase n=1 Tax=Nannocystis pusilla TaxID=889268 RepID=UPI003B810807
MQQPEHRTICEFRKRHLTGLGRLFVQVLKTCQRMGLVKLGHVALDGTKIQANAARPRGCSVCRAGDERRGEAK